MDNRTKFKIKSKIRSYTEHFLKNKIFERYNNKCVTCNSEVELEVHHKVYRWKPLLKDCIILCKQCHQKLDDESPIVIDDTFQNMDKSVYKIANTDLEILELIKEYPEGNYDIARGLNKDVAHIYRRLKYMDSIGLLTILNGYPLRYILKEGINFSKLFTYVECIKCKQIRKIPRSSYVFMCERCKKKQVVYEKNIKKIL